MMKVEYHISFYHDEQRFVLGDVEEFKVNKTRESRKMAKEVKKQLKQTTNEPKVTPVPTPSEEIPTTREDHAQGELEIRCQ